MSTAVERRVEGTAAERCIKGRAADSHMGPGRGKARRRHVMFVFFVDHWAPPSGWVIEAFYAVRARNVEDCVAVLYKEYVNEDTREENIAMRERVRAQVMESKKVKLFHKYAKSKVVADMVYAG